MSGSHDESGRAPAPTEPPARTGEGAQTALLALIRRRKLQVDDHEHDAIEPPPPPLADR